MIRPRILKRFDLTQSIAESAGVPKRDAFYATSKLAETLDRIFAGDGPSSVELSEVLRAPNVSQAQAKALASSIGNAVAQALGEGQKVTLSRYGSFGLADPPPSSPERSQADLLLRTDTSNLIFTFNVKSRRTVAGPKPKPPIPGGDPDDPGPRILAYVLDYDDKPDLES
jgi:hypothetical protein